MMTITDRTGTHQHPHDHGGATAPVAGRPPAHNAALVCVGASALAGALVMEPYAQVEDPPRKVSGTVVAAATQQPVPNASVMYEENGQQKTTVTDANGYFEFPAGRLGVVTVTARDFGTARRRWPDSNSTSLDLVVELRSPATMRGTVNDLVTGQSVPALVNVMVQHTGNFVSYSTTTAGGTFQIDDLPPGPALVTARSVGFAPFAGSTTLESGKVRDVQVGLLQGAQATGHVRDTAGEPVTGAFVSARYPNLAGASLLEGFIGGRPLTRTDGVFALHGLVPDTSIALQAELNGQRSTVHTITVTPGMRLSDIILTMP